MKDYEKMTREELLDELKRVNVILSNLQIKTDEDVLILALLEKSPFTVWACDKNYRIVLWNDRCEEVYGIRREDAMGKDFTHLFVSEYERQDARNDCRAIIERNKVFKNFIAQDETPNGDKRKMLTNCFRMKDAQQDRWLQVEIGLEINDIQESMENWRSLREAGIELAIKNRKHLELEQKYLTLRVDTAHVEKVSSLKNEIRNARNALRNLDSQVAKQQMSIMNQQKNKTKRKIDESREQLRFLIASCTSVDECELLVDKIEEFENLDIDEV